MRKHTMRKIFFSDQIQEEEIEVAPELGFVVGKEQMGNRNWSSSWVGHCCRKRTNGQFVNVGFFFSLVLSLWGKLSIQLKNEKGNGGNEN